METSTLQPFRQTNRTLDELCNLTESIILKKIHYVMPVWYDWFEKKMLETLKQAWGNPRYSTLSILNSNPAGELYRFAKDFGILSPKKTSVNMNFWNHANLSFGKVRIIFYIYCRWFRRHVHGWKWFHLYRSRAQIWTWCKLGHQIMWLNMSVHTWGDHLWNILPRSQVCFGVSWSW